MFDYMTLRLLWWAILGVLLIGFAILDGFDLGVAILHPFVAKTDVQRRVTLNSIGPVWEGNQVWFILGGGAVFAAWPLLYAASFSGFYLAMLLVLLGLILRPVAITFRSKHESAAWRARWDWIFFISGLVPSLLFGVAVGNLFLGAPFHFDSTLRLVYEGGLLGLLHPFALLCGLVSVAMIVMQGAAWLSGKTEGEVADNARRIGERAAIALIVFFTVAGAWVAFGLPGYRVEAGVDPNGPSNPLLASATVEAGAWLSNYRDHPATMAAPALAYIGAIFAAVLLSFASRRLALLASSLSIAGVILTAGFSLFPFLMPSSTVPAQSLTIWNASSSKSTLGLMLFAVIVFLPIILAYTSWVYYVLRGPVTDEVVEAHDDYPY